MNRSQLSTLTEHIANLTRSSYFHPRRLRGIRRSVSSAVFTSIIHELICSGIDYPNSLLVGLPKVRLSPLQSVMRAAARLTLRLPGYFCDILYQGGGWLPLDLGFGFRYHNMQYSS